MNTRVTFCAHPILSLLIGISMNTLLERIKNAFKAWPFLATYLALWFCAITFYNQAALHVPEKDIQPYVFVIIQALIFSKLMLTAEMIIPIGLIFRPTVKSTIYLSIIVRTTLASILVIMLRYLAAGTEGFFRGQDFFESMQNFCDGDMLHILALTCLYWLIVLPYITLRFVLYLAGGQDIATYLIAARMRK